MGQGLQFKEMLSTVEIALECIPEHRKGQNTKVEQSTSVWMGRNRIRPRKFTVRPTVPIIGETT